LLFTIASGLAKGAKAGENIKILCLEAHIRLNYFV